jgi:hypothetical protein
LTKQATNFSSCLVLSWKANNNPKLKIRTKTQLKKKWKPDSGFFEFIVCSVCQIQKKETGMSEKQKKDQHGRKQMNAKE